MPKRKNAARNGDTADDDSDSSDTNMLDVEFEFFDPAQIDFHGLKMLLRQLFDADADDFDLSALSDTILAQPLLGSTVKCPDDEHEAKDNDPFAFLTVLNATTLSKTNHAVRTLAEYLARKAQKNDKLSKLNLPSLLQGQEGAEVGLVLTERFINIPAEIVPPMYSMLVEEIEWAIEEKEPYRFTHYLVLSKTYTEIESKLDSTVIMEEDDDDRSSKKAKVKKGSGSVAETFYFHPEDEVLHQFATGFGDFEYDKERDDGASDAKRAFQEAGIKPLGHMILIEASKFKGAVERVKQYLGGAP